MSELRLISAGMTDRGQTRKVNEDTILNQTGLMKPDGNFGLYMVCDGLGGHQAGDVASQIAVQTVAEELKPIMLNLPSNYMNSADINHRIMTSVQKANQAIWSQAHDNGTQTRGMGTTLTMAFVVNDKAHIGHVGDSRLYLLRDDELMQLTRDHTMAAALAEAGHITEEEASVHPRQNILTKALGRREKVDVDLMEQRLLPGDRLLLCSDGFWKAFKEKKTLENWLNRKQKTADLCQKMLAQANKIDGSDNISLIIVSVVEKQSSFDRYRFPKVRKGQKARAF